MSGIQALQAKLKQENIDAMLIASEENRRYLSGFTGTFGYVLLSQSDGWFFTDSRYTLQAREQVKDLKVVQLEHFALPLAIKQIMDTRELATLALESNRVTLEFYQSFCNQFGRKAIIPTVGWVEELRMIKSEEEIAMIAQAEKIGDLAFEHILGYIKPGISELDVALELEYYMKKQGASSLSFTTIVASGARSQMPHGVASAKKIEMGDLITMDYGCIYQGYCSDMTRTVALGSITDEQKRTYELVKEAQVTAINAVKAGVVGKDIDDIARKVFREHNVSKYFGHGLGHSLGLEVHEEPRFSITDNHVMQENMVMTVEPGLYMPGYGVRIEDVIVVKEDGCINLTNSSKELIII